MLVKLIAGSVVTIAVFKGSGVLANFGANAMFGSVDMHTRAGRAGMRSIAGRVAVGSVAVYELHAPSVTSGEIDIGGDAG